MVFSIPIFIFTVFNFTPLQLVTGVFLEGGVSYTTIDIKKQYNYYLKGTKK